FDIPKSSFVKLTIFEVSGKMIEVPVNQNLSAGTYNVDFDAAKLSSGIYFYKLEAGEFTQTKKMMVIK
ncbi:MAG TPA: T9SS type A sorting domain-containing protein, partial [Ignavibacteria bacterium]|nr:T9SS type A sorting domain-containing protein [Ignavibacteria bacterium]